MTRRRPGRGSVTMGIDPSSRKLAVVAIVPSGRFYLLSKPLVKAKEKGGSPVACAAAYEAITDFATKIAVESGTTTFNVAIEAPIVGRGGIRVTLAQTFVSGAIQAALAEFLTDVHVIFPSQWKKAVVGRGNADKSDVARHLRSVWPTLADQIGSDQDLFDAAALCLYAEQQATFGL